MNDKDRKRVYRLKRLVERVPLPADGAGTQSQSLTGTVTFARDMREVKEAHWQITNGMLLDGVNGQVEGWDYEPVDLSLDALERWIDQRSLDQWSFPSGSFLTYKQVYTDLVKQRTPPSETTKEPATDAHSQTL